MADDGLSEAWEKAAKDITKGKNEGALQTLRVADPHAIEPMTARLVGEATWNIAKSSGSKSDYRKAAMFLREASKKNPKDKKTGSLYNKLLNEMQDKRISETVIPRMFNNGGPTPAGIFAIFGGFLLVLGLITIANSEPTTTDIVEFDISWSENGVAKSGQVTIELYPDAAPIHVENFRLLIQNGDYDGTSFHRVIGDSDDTPDFDPFMIQGGDFTNGDGTGVMLLSGSVTAMAWRWRLNQIAHKVKRLTQFQMRPTMAFFTRSVRFQWLKPKTLIQEVVNSSSFHEKVHRTGWTESIQSSGKLPAAATMFRTLQRSQLTVAIAQSKK